MAQLTKQEMINKINEKVTDEDVAIELIEDVSDSFIDEAIEQYKAQYEQEKADLEAQLANEKAYYLELKRKYKERFLQGEGTEPTEPTENNGGELSETTIVDIKDI